MDIDILSKLIITKVYSAAIIYTHKNTLTQRDDRPCWAIVIKYEGETIYKTNGKTYLSNIHNMVILPKGCSYEWCCIHSGHYAIIEFQSELTHNEIFTFPVKDSEKILSIFKRMEYYRNAQIPLYEAESIRDTYSIILTLAHSSQKQYVLGSKRQKLLPALEYIASHYNTEIKNDDLAALTDLSTVYFRKLFKDIYGISPIAYVHNLRINKATEMLRSDYGSFTDIALSLGYNNIYEFSKDFKNHTGISPTQYVKTKKL